MEWFFRLAGKRRPDAKLLHMMAWNIINIPLLRVRLCVLLKSRKDPPMFGVQAYWRVLAGALTFGKRVPIGYVKATHEYLLSDLNGQWATCDAVEGDEIVLRIDDAYRYSLNEPAHLGESMIMLPWMSIQEKHSYMHLAESPVWVLVVEWGLNARRSE